MFKIVLRQKTYAHFLLMIINTTNDTWNINKEINHDNQAIYI